ncbi:tail tube GTA-gp10-like protein [Ancylobacter aquaticus]|uniref:Tail tube GTA-gp10-like protein n=1 Tax=Ancylobacter aquaticus TaxID=100 RepID=A0A4V2PK65_ANCAQ|nr:gene transfer agent family protein [Ancylobacter aquaticus]TCK31236.1 tail tube GTA-gp10-like protein [Ancylobacter aquaticus]
MATDARIELDWADGTHVFRLAIGQLAELQDKTNAGPLVLFERLRTGSWRIEDITNTIRLGLMGGGMPPVDALKKVRTYVEDRPWTENVPTAMMVLMAALYGAPEDDSGNVAAAEPEIASTISPTAG